MTDEMTFQSLTDQMLKLYTAGNYAEAQALVEESQAQFPEEIAHTTFWRLCLLSRCNRPEATLSLFKEGLANGLWWAESQFGDPDFDAVRELPEFKRLVDESSRKCLAARKQLKPERTVLVPEGVEGYLPLLIALHGRGGNKEQNLADWQTAVQRGWLVLSPQSRQALSPGSCCWDDPAQGMDEILLHVDEIMQAYRIDRTRILLAGFSQGSGMSIYTALSGKLPVSGFIGIGTWWADVDELDTLAKSADKALRGYFVTGLKDHTLERAREIQNILRKNNIQIAEEVHEAIGHEFPSDFDQSFENALKFILEK